MAGETSKTRTFVDGTWLDGNPGLVGPRSHAIWQGTSVFDGSRWFEGVAPDLDRHCARVNRSAEALGLKALVPAEEIARLTWEGLEGFDGSTAVYIRPMYWAEEGGFMGVPADPNSTRFLLCLYETPMQPPTKGLTLGVSPFRRPGPETMPTAAKAGCLYPNSGRAIMEAAGRGFDNALMLDPVGNVAETATSNIFLVIQGVVKTPTPNGCLLDGITRQRVIKLLREAGREVVECSLTVADFLAADEVFTTGNFSKVVPIARIEGRDYGAGEVWREAREAYWRFAGINASA